MKRISTGLMAVMAMTTAANAQEVARYVGTDGNWFNPRNWSTGRVPSRTTDVVIGGQARVTIDPARGGSNVAIRDLWLRDEAVLETRPGTWFFSRNEWLADGSYLVHRSSVAGSSSPVGSIIVTTYNGWHLNPSPQIKRNVILKTGIKTNLELGGATPASTAGFGPGHYATITADYMRLAGSLNVGLMYGFQPQPGQTFQIVTVNRWGIGQFDNLREGAMAARFGNVGLFITYRGGDGNDVVLTARQLAVTP
jgi:hypothetical protein